MSGFVAVVSTDRDPTRAHDEAAALAEAYADLREPLAPVASPATSSARAHSVGTEVRVSVETGAWTVVLGQAHGDLRNPVISGDVAALDGQVCLVSHDPGHDRTVVATDRTAAAPVYVAQRPGLLLVSTSAMVLARHLRAPADPDAVRNFLVSGYQFGAETYWEGVRRLEPGRLVEVHQGRVVEHTFWQPSVDAQVEAMTLQQTTDRLLEVGVETYRARLGGHQSWLDLTGGYDSRLMALLLAEAGVPFTGHTRDSTVTPDVTLAAEVADVAGWPWEPMSLPTDWPHRIADSAQRALVAADGRLEVLELSRVVWWHEQLARTRPGLLSAGGGEHLQYYAWNTELPFPGRSRANVSRWVDMIGLKPTDLAVLQPGARAATKAAYVDRLERWIEPYSAEPSTRQLDLCYLYKSGGHFGAYRAADDLVLSAQLPYYFEPVLSAAFSTHHRHRGGFRLMREMMHRLAPAVAAIETTRGGPALPMHLRTARRYLPYYGLLARKGLNKVAGQLGARPPLPLQDPVPPAERDAVPALERSLADRGIVDWQAPRVRPLLSDDGLRRLASGEVGAGMLGRVLTAEMALHATDASL